MMITQIIAEWSFHKSVDLIRSGIPQEHWDTVMQKIAFTIFEIAKQTFRQGMPQDQILQLIEHHVKKTYLDAIAELKDKGVIDEGLMEQASKQSNMVAMMQQMSEEQAQAEAMQDMADPNVMQKQGAQPQTQVASSPKIMKLATVALLFQKMKQDKVQILLDKFSPDDAQTVVKYMAMPDLKSRVSVGTAIKCLNEIKTNLPKPQALSPTKIIAKIKEATMGLDKKQLESMLQMERMKVRRLVFNALEDEFYEVAPRVANIIANHIQENNIVATEEKDSV